MSLPGNDLLAQIEHSEESPTLAMKLGIYFRRYINKAIETVAQNSAVDASSEIPAPAPPESINVTTVGEYMQIVVNHTAPAQKGAQYISHIATNPQFLGSIIKDHGCSRSPEPFFLPTKDGSGNTHSYYIGTIVQYPGSPPSKPTYWGGTSPAPVTMSGTTQMTLQAGTGSGTASNGNQPFVGIGKAPVRL